MEVVVIKAIPKALLIHTVSHAHAVDEDRWGNEVLKDEQKLKYVRMEPSSKVVRDKNNVEVQLAATMFYDCRNSRPKGMEFSEDDIVIFNGQKHCIQTVEPLYDGERLHHIEMGLVKHA